MLDIILKISIIVLIVTFMFIGIWSFVLFNSFYNQIRYRNYLLEKVSHNIHSLSNNFKKLYDREESKLTDNKDNSST